MKIAFHNLYPSLNDSLFVHSDAPIGDDLLLPFKFVDLEAGRRGHIVGTLKNVRDPDAIVFLDYPDDAAGISALRDAPCPKYLITFENPIVYPRNFGEWARFRRVMTWHDDMVAWSPDRVVKMNYAQDFTATVTGRHDRFMCVVASNKFHPSPDSLYPERFRAVKWFDRHAPGVLDLFGPGWQGITPSWKGTISPGSKREIMSDYRFSLVIENAIFPGYITEKIFDAFIAGTIPIYLGAPNVDRWIDPACFIDARNFEGRESRIDYASLYRYLLNMSGDDADRCVSAIRRWMDSALSIPFRCETFATTVLDTVGAM